MTTQWQHIRGKEFFIVYKGIIEREVAIQKIQEFFGIGSKFWCNSVLTKSDQKCTNIIVTVDANIDRSALGLKIDNLEVDVQEIDKIKLNYEKYAEIYMKYLSFMGKSLHNATTHPITNMTEQEIEELNPKILYYLGEYQLVAVVTKLT